MAEKKISGKMRKKKLGEEVATSIVLRKGKLKIKPWGTWFLGKTGGKHI